MRASFHWKKNLQIPNSDYVKPVQLNEVDGCSYFFFASKKLDNFWLFTSLMKFNANISMESDFEHFCFGNQRYLGNVLEMFQYEKWIFIFMLSHFIARKCFAKLNAWQFCIKFFRHCETFSLDAVHYGKIYFFIFFLNLRFGDIAHRASCICNLSLQWCLIDCEWMNLYQVNGVLQ